MPNHARILAVALGLAVGLAVEAVAEEFKLPDVGSALTAARSGGEVATRDIERFLYVEEDETDVLKEPRGGDDADSLRLTQLRRGERVKVLGELDDSSKTHWYKVEAPRREFDEASGGWKRTEGWVRGSREDASTGRRTESFSENASIARQPVDLKAGPCREAFVKAMLSFEGVPYVWGGTSRKGVDCSGLVQTAMIEAGCVREAPPRTAADQFQASVRRAGKDDMKDGDLVFLKNRSGKVHHVIGFIGNGKVIEAPHSGAVVSQSDLDGRVARAAAKDEIFYGSLLGD